MPLDNGRVVNKGRGFEVSVDEDVVDANWMGLLANGSLYGESEGCR